MALENVMRVDNGNIVTGGGAGGSSVEIDWEDWCKLTPEEQETGDWTIINCPWADGNVSVDLMTKLWENPNPTTAFAAQDITGLTTLKDYDIYVGVFKYSTAATSYITSVLFDGKTIRVSSSEASPTGSQGAISRGRNVTIDSSNNKITFSNADYGYTGTAATANNNVCPPIAIYGIKTTASVKINAIAMDVSTSADKCMMSENESVEDRLDANDFGTAVNITSYTTTKYEAPSDGYLELMATATTNTRIRANIYGQNETSGFGLTVSYNQINSFNSVFIKKGMKIRIVLNENSGVAYFVPIS